LGEGQEVSTALGKKKTRFGATVRGGIRRGAESGGGVRRPTIRQKYSNRRNESGLRTQKRKGESHYSCGVWTLHFLLGRKANRKRRANEEKHRIET